MLVSADINGRFATVIPKVAQLQSKNKFDFMILLGKVCESRSSPFIHEITKQKNAFPLDMFFIDNSDFGLVLRMLHPNGKEIVPGFKYLGNSGVLDVKGLKVAYFNNYDKKEDASVFMS